MKLCIDCKRTLPIGEFFKRGGTREGHCSYCKACTAVRQRARGKRVRANERLAERTPDPLSAVFAEWLRTA